MLILASSSPRRRDLLTQAGIAFTIQPADIDESRRPDEAPIAFATRLAREKAEAVFRKNPGSIVLGADTIVVRDEEILCKPKDRADAARILRLLSGRTHQVITGVAVISQTATKIAAETTHVTMRDLTEKEITAYIATGEPMDKAGAYAIQGGASSFVTHTDGDYTNVIGLPIALVKKLLVEMYSKLGADCS